jgi:uncharacterized DUF497 family protein
MGLLFKWDTGKANTNGKKHGVSFEEATTIFGDPLSATIHDSAHSINEDRFITIGTSANNRLLTVVHADLDDTIRIISAREATNVERRQYENG